MKGKKISFVYCYQVVYFNFAHLNTIYVAKYIGEEKMIIIFNYNDFQYIQGHKMFLMEFRKSNLQIKDL